VAAERAALPSRLGKKQRSVISLAAAPLRRHLVDPVMRTDRTLRRRRLNNPIVEILLLTAGQETKERTTGTQCRFLERTIVR
jgi:methyl coenzyme M reductase subunit C